MYPADTGPVLCSFLYHIPVEMATISLELQLLLSVSFIMFPDKNPLPFCRIFRHDV